MVDTSGSLLVCAFCEFRQVNNAKILREDGAEVMLGLPIRQWLTLQTMVVQRLSISTRSSENTQGPSPVIVTALNYRIQNNVKVGKTCTANDAAKKYIYAGKR